MLVLPGTDEVAALTVAERCRSLIFKEQIVHAKSPVSQILTISMGVGAIVPNHQETIVDFIETVDRRLYLAKQRGRNTIAGEGR